MKSLYIQKYFFLPLKIDMMIRVIEKKTANLLHFKITIVTFQYEDLPTIW